LPCQASTSVYVQKSGRTVGQLDLELPHHRAVDDQPHEPLGRPVLDGQMQVGPVDGQFAANRHQLDLAVALDDVVDVDVSPAAAAVVDDLQHRLLAHQLGDIPAVPIERLAAAGFGVRAGGVRTTWPSTSRFMQVSPSNPPPPIRKLRNFRSMVNRGEVSVPVGPSPP
jgi:hypothetical protein